MISTANLQNHLATIEHHDPILFGAVTDLISRLCETMSARRLSGDHRTIDRVTELDPVAAIVVADHQLQIVRGLIRTSRCITSDISRASLLVLIDAAVQTLEAPWSDLEPEAGAVVDIRGGQA